MFFYFKNTEKDIILTEEDEKYGNINNCPVCVQNVKYDKVRDHCHLTGKYRRPAHNICNNNATQNESNFIPNMFQKFSHFDCHLFFIKLVD